MGNDIGRISQQPAVLPQPQNKEIDFTGRELTPLDVLVRPESDPILASIPGLSMGGGMMGPGPSRTVIEGDITKEGRPDIKQTIKYEHKVNDAPVGPVAPGAELPVHSTAHSEIGTHHNHVTTDSEYRFGFGAPGDITSRGRGEHNQGGHTENSMVASPGNFVGTPKTTTQVGPYRLVFTTQMGPMQLEDPNATWPAPSMDPTKVPVYPKSRITTTYHGDMEDTRTGEKTPLHMELTAHMDPSKPTEMHSELNGSFGDVPISGTATMANGKTVSQRRIGDYNITETMTQEFRPFPMMLTGSGPIPNGSPIGGSGLPTS